MRVVLSQERRLLIKPTRVVILWLCAAVLGLAAGLNYARLAWVRGGAFAQQAKMQGFDSGSDYSQIASMMGNYSINSMDGGQVNLLEKYAQRKGMPSQYVAGILTNVSSDDLALRLV